MSLRIPAALAANCARTPERSAWLRGLPGVVRQLEARWSLTLGAPFEQNVSAAWVAPVTLADGTGAVLKLGMPHMEAEHEIQGLRFWKGEAAVRLLDTDVALGALLLERCQPGMPLQALPESEQDPVIAGLLRRLWQRPAVSDPFRPLSVLMQHWSAETRAQAERWPDAGLVREGLRLFEELPRTASTEVLLATDLHAGNVLRAEREPWLMVDPKPFLGDPAYDATQHLIVCEARLRSRPKETIHRMADLLELDRERVRLWTFARAAAEPRDVWNTGWMEIAKAIAP